MSSPIQPSVRGSLERIETEVLNPFGRLPIASTITGAVRVIIGVAELAFSFLKLLFAGVNGLSDMKTSEDTAAPQLAMAKEFFVHGLGNVCRGIVEMIPLVNLIALPYDYSEEENKFSSSHRISYLPPQK